MRCKKKYLYRSTRLQWGKCLYVWPRVLVEWMRLVNRQCGGRRFQICSCFWSPIHRSCDLAHAQSVVSLFLFWFTTLYITPSLFHSRFKTYIFHKSWPRSFIFFLPDLLHGLLPGPFLLRYLVYVLFFPYFFVSWPCARLSLPYRQHLSAC